jgi:phosphoribosylamine---glycine ligase
MTKVMVVDSGMRGHALAKQYLQSVDKVVVTPGNDGIHNDFMNERDEDGLVVNKDSRLDDPTSVLRMAERHRPDLIEIAQDDALAAGSVDLLVKQGYRVFGPTQYASRIEWDKAWARSFMVGWGIPGPEYDVFMDGDKKALEFGREMLRRHNLGFFKASGLCKGKGAFSFRNEDEMNKAFGEMLKLGDSAKTFLVEEGMRGEEFSYTVIADGVDFLSFKSAQDNKRIWTGDYGPMTGGMGCHAPALVTKGLEEKIEFTIIEPMVKGLRDYAVPFTGIIYLGGMMCEGGNPKVVEVNARWGDPEAEVIVPGIGSDKTSYFDLVNKAVDGKLSEAVIEEDHFSRICVVGASKGYPRSYERGKRIRMDIRNFPEYFENVYSGGIRLTENDMYTDGGRLFSVVCAAKDLKEARDSALQTMTQVNVEGGFQYRTDIGQRDIDRVMFGN